MFHTCIPYSKRSLVDSLCLTLTNAFSLVVGFHWLSDFSPDQDFSQIFLICISKISPGGNYLDIAGGGWQWLGGGAQGPVFLCVDC